jgi:hypothetical protein
LNAGEWLRLGFFMDFIPPDTSVPGLKSTCTRVRKTGATSDHHVVMIGPELPLQAQTTLESRRPVQAQTMLEETATCQTQRRRVIIRVSRPITRGL